MKKILSLLAILVMAVTSVFADDTTGTANATIDGKTVSIGWVQLWKDGPKFATRNVGATASTDKESTAGTTMAFTEAAKTGSDYVWGANWKTPSKDEMDLLNTEKVSITYAQQDDVWGFKITGVQGGYTNNTLFLPAATFLASPTDGVGDYLSSSVYDEDKAWILDLQFFDGINERRWINDDKTSLFHVRPVLSEATPTVTQLTAPTFTVVNESTLETLKTVTVTNPNENGTLMYQWDAQEDGEWAEVPDDGNVTTAAMEIGEHTLYAYVATTDDQTYSSSDVASVTVTTYTPATVAKVALEAVMLATKPYTKGGEAELVVPAAAVMINKAYEYAVSVDNDAEATEEVVAKAIEVLELAVKVAPVIETAFAQETEYGYYRLLGEHISAAYLEYLTINNCGIEGAKDIAAPLYEEIENDVKCMMLIPMAEASAKENIKTLIAANESLGKAMSKADEAYLKLLKKHITTEVNAIVANAREVTARAQTFIANAAENLKQQILDQVNKVLEAINELLGISALGSEDEIKVSEAKVSTETAALDALLNTVVTAINTANADNAAAKTVKVAKNGKLYIQKNNVKYNAAGALVK